MISSLPRTNSSRTKNRSTRNGNARKRSARKRNATRRHLYRGIETLETRRVLAAVTLNEILIDPVGGDLSNDQYIELRGEPNGVIDQGTYLVAVSENDADAGLVHNVFDLSEATIGPNGFLVLLEEGSPHSVDPNSAVLRSTQDGFAGLPLNGDVVDVTGPGGIVRDLGRFTTGVGVSIDTIGSNFDTQIALFDQNGTLLDQNDDINLFLNNLQSQIFSPNLADGTYFVAVAGFSTAFGNGFGATSDGFANAFGNYTIDVNGSAFSSSIGPSQVDFFSFDIGPAVDPGNRFSSLTANSTNLFNEGGTFILLESATPPLPGDDIDTNNDGIADLSSPFGQWNVLESISLRPDSDDFSQAYGELVFLTGDSNVSVTTAPGAEVVFADGFGYAGRLGDSIGNLAEDWIVGRAVDGPGFGSNFSLSQNDGVGSTTPAAFNGRNLDHIGNSNFVGAVRGTVFQGTTDALGDLQNTPAPAVTVLADTNGNGSVDELTFTLDPDNFPTGTNLTNSLEGVSLTAGTETTDHAGVITALRPAGQNALFAASGNIAFDSDSEFRADFYRPARSVSILAVSAGPSTFVRLEAYDANDNLIQSVVSRELIGTATDTITVGFANDVIDHVIAFSDTTQISAAGIAGSPDGRIGQFSYTQNEATALSDASGFYEIPILVTDTYDVTFINPPFNAPLIGAEPVTIDVVMFDNFTLEPNLPPLTEDLSIVIQENPPLGLIVENGLPVTVAGEDEGPVTFRIESGAEFGIDVDAFTGELLVNSNENLDFETNPIFAIEVAVVDAQGVTAISTVSVQLTGVNEPPVVTANSISVLESTENGFVIGEVIANDPEGQGFSFQLVDQLSPGAFSIDPAGVVSVNDSTLIDFETTPLMFIDVLITDDDPDAPLSTFHRQFIDILDANDPPVFGTNNFSISENQDGPIGQIAFSDPDVGQSHLFQLAPGSSPGAIELFTVTSTGAVVVREGAEVDFEAFAPGQAPVHTLSVTVIDNGTPSANDTGQVSITVLDINELPQLQDNQASIGENSAAGSQVATLVIDDPEGAPENHTIELLTNSDSPSFTFDPVSRVLAIAPGASLDFETDPIRDLVFRVTDTTATDPNVQQSADLVFTVNLTDENDAPFLVTESIVVSEGAAPGAEVGEIRVGDFDAVDSFTILETGGTGADQFDISLDGIVTVAAGAELDADVLDGPLTLDVSFTDSDGITVTGTVLVRLNDVNEPPVFADFDSIELPSAFVSVDPFVLEVNSGEPFTFVIPENFAVDPEGLTLNWAVFDPTLVGENDEPDGLPPYLSFDPETRTLTSFAFPTDIGSVDLTIRAFELGFRELSEPGSPSEFIELPLTVNVIEGSNPLSNGRDPRDVNNDRVISALDALNVVNFIQRNGTGAAASLENAITSVPPDAGQANDPLAPTDFEFAGFVDVNGDLVVTPIDALIVINAIGETIQELIPEAESIGVLSDSLSDREEAIDAALADLSGGPSLF